MQKLTDKYRLTAVLRFAAAILTTMTFASAARATPIEFANFRLSNADQPLSFSNNTTFASIIAANVPVVFDFTSQSGLSTVDHAGILSITNTPIATAASAFATILDQPIPSSATLTIIDSNSGMNLLTMTFTGNLIGQSNGPSASLIGAETNGQTVTFSSSFASFAQTDNSYNLGLATISPTLSIGPGGFLSSFVANINGQFTTDSGSLDVPEPASATLFSGMCDADACRLGTLQNCSQSVGIGARRLKMCRPPNADGASIEAGMQPSGDSIPRSNLRSSGCRRPAFAARIGRKQRALQRPIMSLMFG